MERIDVEDERGLGEGLGIKELRNVGFTVQEVT